MNRRRFFAVSWLLALLPASVRAQLDPTHGCTPTFRHGRLLFDPDCTMTIPGIPFEISPPLHLITPFTEGDAATGDFTTPKQRRRDRQRERRRRRDENHKDSGKNSKDSGKNNDRDCNPKSKATTCRDTCGKVFNNCGQRVDCGPCTCATGCHPDCQTCNAATGKCDPINTGKGCDDGNACTTGETCSNGTCGGGTTVVCPANACQIAGTCDPATGCPDPTNKPDGTECGDGVCCRGVCEECCSDTDCEDCELCTNDKTCAENPEKLGSRCDTATGECGVCGETGNCQVTGESCGTGTEAICCEEGFTCCGGDTDNPDCCNNETADCVTGSCVTRNDGREG